jgi:hypothetical protein
MKRITLFLLASTTITYAFAAPQNTTSALDPMDSFNPNKFNASSISEFAKRYLTESTTVLKKGEFETTADYEARIAKGFKTKSLNPDKIYAFKMDSVEIKYNPDHARYELKDREAVTKGSLFGDYLYVPLGKKRVAHNMLRIGTLSRVSDQYKASNAYGKTATVIRLRGKDLYVQASKHFTNVDDDYLIFPAPIDLAKQHSSCQKQVYVFAKLNGKLYQNSAYDYAVIKTPKINDASDIQITKQTIPMDIVGMVLRCSTGTILSTYEQSDEDAPIFKDDEDSRFFYKNEKALDDPHSSLEILSKRLSQGKYGE